MDENEKRKFDALTTLYNRAWENFYQRRIYEWKFALGIWAFFATVIAFMATREFQVSKDFLLTGILLIGILVCYCHVNWLLKCKQRNDLDKNIAFFYEDKLQKILNCEYNKTIKDQIDEIRKDDSIWDWNVRIQLLITCLFFVAVIFVICLNKSFK